MSEVFTSSKHSSSHDMRGLDCNPGVRWLTYFTLPGKLLSTTSHDKSASKTGSIAISQPLSNSGIVATTGPVRPQDWPLTYVYLHVLEVAGNDEHGCQEGEAPANDGGQAGPKGGLKEGIDSRHKKDGLDRLGQIVLQGCMIRNVRSSYLKKRRTESRH